MRWKSHGPEGGTVVVPALAVAPSAPAMIYAGTEHGVFKTTDAGVTWDSLNNGLAFSVRALVLDPSPIPLCRRGSTRGPTAAGCSRPPMAGRAGRPSTMD